MDKEMQAKIAEGIEKVEAEMKRTGMHNYVASILVLNRWEEAVRAEGIVLGIASVVLNGEVADGVLEGVLGKFDYGEEADRD